MLRDVAYDIYVRAGLISYLGQKFDEAVGQFRTAQKYAPPRNFVVVAGKIASGPERLVSAAEQGKSGHPLTPKSVAEGPPQVSLILMLADLYHESQNYPRSIDLTTRALDGLGIGGRGPASKSLKSTPDQRSWAHFKRARSRYASLADLPRTAAAERISF